MPYSPGEYNTSMQELLLPLFPLEVVLFPRADLALHIFEDRYKEMIADCLEHQWEFGVVLMQENSSANIGCTAAISEVVRKYDDGRMDIVVRGTRRFEVLFLDRAKPYLRGAAQFFEDEGGAVAEGDGRRTQAIELYQQVTRLLESEESDALAADDLQLSYRILARLPVDLSFKQSLLEIRSESELLTQVIAYLRKVAARLEWVTHTRAKAGGNGRRR